MSQSINVARAARQPVSRQIKGDTSLPEKLFLVLIYGFVALFALISLLPFWLVVVGSFTPETILRTKGFQLFPNGFSTYAYQFVLNGRQIFHSYGVTLTVTILGTTLALLVTTPFAYVLASRKAKLAPFLSFMTYFTMIFGGGLVGTYILIANWLHLKDTIWALILPYLLNPFYAFILVAFFRTIPYELVEAATIDGANELTIFARIIVPIAKPAIATVGLFYALQYWNDWWLALLFIDNPDLHPLQLMIRQLYALINAADYVGANASLQQEIPGYGLRMATVCLTIGPIILLYPFIQRYFVNGLTIGAVKG